MGRPITLMPAVQSAVRSEELRDDVHLHLHLHLGCDAARLQRRAADRLARRHLAPLAVSVFLLAIIFTGIEFDDIVLGVALNLEDEQNVALGLVLGTAVSFTGIVLALGAIFTPTQFKVPREYIVIFAAAPLIMVVLALRKEVTTADAVVLILLFLAWIAYVAHREMRRETATFRNLEIVEEAEEAVSTLSRFSLQGRYGGWLNLGIAVLAICGIVVGAATVSTGSDQILRRYGIEGTVFGATIVTAVLSIEDLFLTVQPIRKGVPEIGIGNVIGSLVFSVTGKLGIVVLGGGAITIGSNTLRWHLPVLVGMTALAAYFLSTGQIKRWHGYVLLALYVAYWIVSFSVYGGAPVDD
jgi:cation:H+ antiporter